MYEFRSNDRRDPAGGGGESRGLNTELGAAMASPLRGRDHQGDGGDSVCYNGQQGSRGRSQMSKKDPLKFEDGYDSREIGLSVDRIDGNTKGARPRRRVEASADDLDEFPTYSRIRRTRGSENLTRMGLDREENPHAHHHVLDYQDSAQGGSTEGRYGARRRSNVAAHYPKPTMDYRKVDNDMDDDDDHDRRGEVTHRKVGTSDPQNMDKVREMVKKGSDFLNDNSTLI